MTAPGLNLVVLGIFVALPVILATKLPRATVERTAIGPGMAFKMLPRVSFSCLSLE